MSAESVQCAVTANRDVPDCAPNLSQDCRDEVHIAVFFDGTGNNKDADDGEKKWSNIARLFASAYRAVQTSKKANIYPIYISGVGTQFNGEAVGWLDKSFVWVEDNIGGGGAGAGGDRRIAQGEDLVNEYLRIAMIAGAQRLGGAVAKYATENSDKGFNDLNVALSKHRLVKSINISVFGFSRGAALARAFTNRLVNKCMKNGNELLYQGHPLRINFMGLFDTVASFGVPSQNARTPFAERELTIPPIVERCVHYVAAHELRFSFPVDLIRKDGKLAENWVEKVFPGVHSDVGGGYAPKEQGVDDNYARIPLREMLKEAVLSGVRIISYDDLNRLHNGFFQERFECQPETEAAYSRYVAACATVSGAVEHQIAAHMKLYYSANGTMHRKRIVSVSEKSIRSSKVKSVLGPKGMAAEVAAWRSIGSNAWLMRVGGPIARSFAQYMKIREWQLAAWDKNASDGVVEFVGRYVHDSKVDFLLNAEPFSYFSSRGVAESGISIWQEGGNWLRSTGTTASAAVSGAVKRGEGKVRTIGDAANKFAKEATQTVQNTAIEAIDFASSKAKESTQSASRAYAATVDTGTQAIVAGKRTMDELGKDAERIYESGTNWIRQKFE
jgi:hypothetical protein